MDLLKKITSKLLSESDEKTKESGQRFFKEEVKIHGVKTAIVFKIAKEFFAEIKNKSKEEIFELCEELWETGFIEESFVACHFAKSQSSRFEKTDFPIFERWVKTYIGNWASCDTFCNHTVGEMVFKFPEFLKDLKKWTHSENRWVRRASAVSLIIPAKRGFFLKDVFEIADLLLEDKDDMVQKGYGWMLKVASFAHEKEVFDFVMKNKKKMPRTALRYAIEKMPKNLKERAMSK